MQCYLHCNQNLSASGFLCFLLEYFREVFPCQMTVIQVRLVLACTVAVYILLFRSPWEKFPGEHHIKALRWDKVNTVEPPLHLSTTSTSPQWQQPPKHVPNCQNNLSATASFVSEWWNSQDWCVHDLSQQSHFDCVLFILLQLA